MKIAVLDDYQNVARSMADWSGLEAQHQVTFFNDIYEGLEGFAKRLAPFDIVCITRERSPFKADIIDRLPNLKLVVTAGMRNAAIDMEACKARGIPVLGTSGSVQATPELAWGLMLSLARNIHIEDQRMRGGAWITTLGTDLQGKTLGILGLGRIGRIMASVARAFEMEPIAWSANLTAESAAEAGVERVEKDDLFRRADFLTIHYKLGERSRGLVGARELGLMKPTAFLVNTSRGPVVDTDALIAALTHSRIAGAGIDVYDAEPLAPDHPLRKCPRTLLTPHLGYVTDGTYRLFFGQMVESLESWLNGKPIRVLA
ncbi:MAG TPA: D-2-hydroxyacid dehydrogenase family protein [Thermohalobaculum sp.]|nr:D-2-hydroxyacid dehydrogenase family protein [Thermohalobaculum sp.]